VEKMTLEVERCVIVPAVRAALVTAKFAMPD
jgi:hypothetical protein